MSNESLPTRHQTDVYMTLGEEAEVLWSEMRDVSLDIEHLHKQRVVTVDKSDIVHKRFDMLRTRLLLAMRKQGWTRVAVTAPTEGCGTSFVAANLAFSISHMEQLRTILLDMNLEQPAQAKILGVEKPGSMEDFLHGDIAPEEFLIRANKALALGLNSTKSEGSAELLQDSMTIDVIREMQDLLCPDMVIFDLPPVLGSDDVIGFLPNVDAVLLVVGGGQSTADEIKRAELALGDHASVLGIVLNKAEGLFQ